MTERLDVIDKLVLGGSTPAEIRGHIIAMREQLEANEQEAAKVPEYKKRIAELDAEKLNLVDENTKLKRQPPTPPKVIMGGFPGGPIRSP